MDKEFEKIVMRPIGVIRSPYKTAEETPRWYEESGDTEAVMEIDPAYSEAMADMEAGKEYTVVFCFHKSKGFKQTVSIRGDGPMTALFSTHSPSRPNPIGISVIKVKSVDGNMIRFTGVDMIDGTPVLDIKS